MIPPTPLSSRDIYSIPPPSLDLGVFLRRMRSAQRSHQAPSCDARVAHLDRLEEALLRRKGALVDAIQKDFGNRSRHETLIADIFVTLNELKFARAHLRAWMQPRPRHVGLSFLPAHAVLLYQPLGVVGIISPWNYPVQLAIAPLIGALAAGNRVIIKPSELTPATGEALKDLIAETFDPDHVAVVTGGPSVGEAFSRLPFDHLVFTGSTRVGKAVMRAASENLVPLVLELGGKSPAIVGDDFDIVAAAERIMMGKLFNSGQTCVAPDYVLVPEDKRDAFVDAARDVVANMYPTLQKNQDYTCVINDRHYARLQGYIDDARGRGARVIEINPARETLDPKDRKLCPTLLLDVSDDALVMQEEIFGPLLPIKTYRALSEAIDFVNDKSNPLALYYFGHDRRQIDRVLSETLSGGVGINETMAHVAQEDLPFGGVGASGMGAYHGFDGFEAFSKKKPVFYQSRIRTTGLLSPPYGRMVDTFLRWILGK